MSDSTHQGSDENKSGDSRNMTLWPKSKCPCNESSLCRQDFSVSSTSKFENSRTHQGSLSFTTVDTNVPFKLYLQNLTESLERSFRAKFSLTKVKTLELKTDRIHVEADSSSGGALETHDQSGRTTKEVSFSELKIGLRGNILSDNITAGEVKKFYYETGASDQGLVLLPNEGTTDIVRPQNQIDRQFVTRMYTPGLNSYPQNTPRADLFPGPFLLPNFSHLSWTPSSPMSSSAVKAWPSKYRYLYGRQAHDVHVPSQQCCRYRRERNYFCTSQQQQCTSLGVSRLKGKETALYTEDPKHYLVESKQAPEELDAQRRGERNDISNSLNCTACQFTGPNIDFSKCRTSFRISSKCHQHPIRMKQNCSSTTDWRVKTRGRWGSAPTLDPPMVANRTGSEKQEAVRKYKCDVCEKAFSRSNTLVTHRRIHTGDKPFCCDVCGRAFRQPGNLTRHRLTHTAYKPFVCHFCSKAFNRSSNLSTHIKTHTRSDVE